jgi:uncharacterized damage-inducible protein DinB
MMKRVLCFVSAAVLVSVSLTAQGPAPQTTNLPQYLQRAYNGLKNNLTRAADMLPESDYAFKPSSMPEMRTFGQLFGHVANAQFGQCAAAKGVPNPNMGVDNEQKKSKAEIQKALAASFAFCDDAFASLTEENGTQMMAQGRGQTSREAILAGLVAHSNEMYGYAAVYLRAKNVVPPSTDEAQRNRAGGAGRGGRGQ